MVRRISSPSGDAPTTIVPMIDPDSTRPSPRGRPGLVTRFAPWVAFAIAAVVVLAATSAWSASLRGPGEEAPSSSASALQLPVVPPRPVTAVPPELAVAPEPEEVEVVVQRPTVARAPAPVPAPVLPPPPPPPPPVVVPPPPPVDAEKDDDQDPAAGNGQQGNGPDACAGLTPLQQLRAGCGAAGGEAGNGADGDGADDDKTPTGGQRGQQGQQGQQG